MKRGQCVFRQKGRLTACTWKDNKFVHLLTTMPATGGCSTVTRTVKQKGKWVQKEVQRPAIAELYNKFMGGVDLADQRVRSYQRNTKSYVWYMKLFFYFVEVAIMNAYLLERKSPHHNPPAAQKARLMLPFRRELITKVIGGLVYRRQQQSNQSLPDERRFDLSLGHFPVLMPTRSHCKVHMQRVDTQYACSVCYIRMCPAPCFQRFHTLEDYYYDDEDRGDADVVRGTVRGRPRKRARGRLSV